MLFDEESGLGSIAEGVLVKVLDKFLGKTFIFGNPADAIGTGSLRAGGFNGNSYWLTEDAVGGNTVCDLVGDARVSSKGTCCATRRSSVNFSTAAMPATTVAGCLIFNICFMKSSIGAQKHTSLFDMIPLSSLSIMLGGESKKLFQLAALTSVVDGGPFSDPLSIMNIIDSAPPEFSPLSELLCLLTGGKGNTLSRLSSISSAKSGSGAMAPTGSTINPVSASLATDDTVKVVRIILLLSFESIGMLVYGRFDRFNR